MNQEMWDGIRWILGLGAEPKTLTFLQMALRVVIMYIAGLSMVRLAGVDAKQLVADIAALVVDTLILTSSLVLPSGHY